MSSRMILPTVIGSFGSMATATLGSARYFSSVVRYRSARSMKYLPFLLNTGSARTASAIRSRSFSCASPPAMSAASSRDGKDAWLRSRLRSSVGSV